MTSGKEAQRQPSSENLLAKLNQIYARRPIQHDIFGRRPALLSEIARSLAMSTALPVRQKRHDDELAPIPPLNRTEE